MLNFIPDIQTKSIFYARLQAVSVLNLESGESSTIQLPHTDNVVAVATVDNVTMVTICIDSMVRVWDLTKVETASKKPQHESTVM